VLGRTLFFDPRLSGSKFISCATCHNPGFAWGDGLPKGIGDGMKPLKRRTPTILNAAYGDLMFWDGRADSLEAQALGPIQSAAEMNMPLGQAVERVSSLSGYRPLFEKAYPGEPVSGKTIAKAIATFERTVVSGQAPFDRWIDGDDRAISEQARRGFDLFNHKAECVQCHSGWNFTDSGFHDIGVNDEDLGRGALLKIEAMQHAFKTPTLRNVAVRAPYMHNGSELNLEAVVDFYDEGGKAQRPSLATEIHPLHLTADEKADVVEFLRTLTSTDKAIAIPALPR
jgi:cytochrome c peroxidase